jgi:hypothetical protein
MLGISWRGLLCAEPVLCGDSALRSLYICSGIGFMGLDALGGLFACRDNAARSPRLMGKSIDIRCLNLSDGYPGIGF